ncbi:non-ribosomal peptide synthetase, partial [Burkholderia ubonensis]|uniref:non-ribosomal peptide synthetase n=1 Tax=Burkholderia ubonensis TaxID=101571 RepID=UPI001178A77E
GVELPLRAVFETPTVAGLAAIVDRTQSVAPHGAAGGPELDDLLRVLAASGDARAADDAIDAALRRQPAGGAASAAVDAATLDGMTAADKRALLARLLAGPAAAPAEVRTAPLSFAQERLWFFDQLHPNGALYNVPLVLRLRAPLRAPVLERALNEIVRRHETLRTRFEAQDGKPVQRIAGEAVVPFVISDLQGLPAGEREAAAQAIAAEEAARPFDLGTAPLLRARLVRLGDADHVILLTLHHIVSDGWSMRVLYRELGALYAAFDEGRASPLRPLAIQYADFAAWQREWLQGDTLASQLGYWRDQLAGAPAVLTLPSDRPRPAVQSYRGGLLPFTIDAASTSALRALAQAEGGTLFMVLLGAFAVLLARLSGQHDVVVGTPIANRTREELEDLIGFFVNTLVLRTRIDARASFRTLLAGVRETTLAAYAHQDLPFERLVEELQPERSLAYNPLFQVLFTLQTDGESRAGTGAGTAQPADPAAPRNGMARFDLSLAITDHGAGLGAVFEFSRDLFDDATIGRMAAQFQTLLAAIARQPDLPVRRLPLLSAAERHALLHDWNGPRHPYVPDLPVTELIAQLAAAFPDRPALDAPDGRLSYRELMRRAQGVAVALAARGIGAEDRVGVCLRPSAAFAVAFLGVLQAGAAYVPLDPALPCRRLAHIATEASLRIVLGDPRDGHDWIPDGIALVDPADTAAVAGAFAYRPQPLPAQCAYVIFTSGSTGTPKGVAVTHQGLARVVFNQRALLRLTPADRVLSFAAVGFDASIFEMLLAWSAGACLHVAPAEARVPGAPLAALLRERRITAAVLPPAACAITPDANLPEFALLMMAGEAVEPAVAARWAAGRRVVNGYGPSETAIWVSTGGYDPATGRMPIGRPCINTRLYVLDPYGEPVPPGVAGELYIGGDGLARGYLGRPDLTAERFVPDPFSGEPGARLYRSGDLVRLRADGTLDFLGRTDEQVKIRGFRIELGEIEAVLSTAPGVGDAAVVAHGEGAQRRLDAHLASADPALDVEAVRHYLRERLPGYMVPSAFYVHAALPLTPNGKVDRAALAAAPAPVEDVPEEALPRTETEAAVAAIWAELLETARIDIQRSFFEIGGHSLLATQLVSRLRDRFGVELPLRAVFETPTVAGLAAIVDRTQSVAPHGAAGGPELDDLLRVLAASGDARAADDAIDAALRRQPAGGAASAAVDAATLDGMTAADKRALLARLLAGPAAAPAEVRTAPLSFAQERLWFFDQLHPNGALYNVPLVLRLRAPLRAPVLERALNEIVRRHETLRTRFEAQDGKPVQRIAGEAVVPFVISDLQGLPAGEREAAAQAIAAEEAARP